MSESKRDHDAVLDMLVIMRPKMPPEHAQVVAGRTAERLRQRREATPATDDDLFPEITIVQETVDA